MTQHTKAPTTSDATPAESASVSRSSSYKQSASAGAKVALSGIKTAWSLHPLFIMGEAVTGHKAGATFMKNSKELVSAGEELRGLLALSSKDVLIIINEQLKSGNTEAAKTGEVIKSAGSNAVVVVSRHLESAQEQMKASSPQIKRAIAKNGREVILVFDKALKNPIVITGITKFAQSKGIPQSAAVISLASLALAKILAAIPDEEPNLGEEKITEIDAEELHRTSTREAEEEAENVGRQAGAETTTDKDGKSSCIVS